MQVAVEIPDDMADALKAREPELSRALLESYAADAYRKGELSRGQVRRLLGLDFYAGEDWFHKKRIPMNYGVEDFEQDLRTIDELFPRK